MIQEITMRLKTLVPLVALAALAQSCCCCTILGGPEPPYAVTPSDEAIAGLKERFVPREDGSFTITITDEEATSVAVKALAQQEDAIPISDPQVFFRNGRVEAYGTVHMSGSLASPGMIAFSIAVDSNDQPTVIIEEMVVGPLPAPAPILETANEEIHRVLQENTGAAIITDVQIGDKQMTISGRLPPAQSPSE
jgi:hypothetical protein